MARLVLSILVGVVVAFALVFASDWLFHMLVPSASAVPAEADDPGAMAAYVAAQPMGVLVGLALGWAIAAFVGTAMAAQFAGRAWPGWVVGAIVLVATASNFVMIPHPTWMVALALVAIVAATWLGAGLGCRPLRAPDEIDALRRT